MSIVETKNVSKTYAQGKVSVQALRDISLSVGKGEFMALCGPSGSGKTTLLNLIGGLDKPDNGSVILDDQELTTMRQGPLAELRLHKVGFIFQSYNLVPVLTAQENVEFVMLLQGVPARERTTRARNILDEVGLSEHHNRRPAELSGGQQQRVAVARAIVSNPAIILADEPTANLDSKTGESLLQMMHGLNKEKQITFIFSTHDQMVMDHARRLTTLHDGKLTADETKH